jgi:hypothetical protein
MKKLTTGAVAVAVMSVGIAAAGGPAAADESVNVHPLSQAKHTLTFNRAFNEALKVARSECERDMSCISYDAGPTCTSNSRHKWECPIHKITGVPGDQHQQQDCVRPVQLLIKRISGRKPLHKFLSSTYTCGPNVNYPGL